MTNGEIIAARLTSEHGVVFDNQPDRALFTRHGDSADTFLVYQPSWGNYFTTQVGWRWANPVPYTKHEQRGLEIGLGDTAAALVKARALDVQINDEFSQYGQGIWVSVDRADAHVVEARTRQYLTRKGYRSPIDEEFDDLF